MSISRKIYDSVLRIKSFTERKTFQYSLTAFLAILLFFGTFNVYAQDEEGISPDWEGTKTFHNVISGTEADEDNMNSRQGLEMLNGGWTAISLIAPEITANSEDVMSNLNIPNDLKRGLLGMVEDSASNVYASYPTINIPSHLAQQWVPGYKESVSSLYAANSSSGHLSGYEELMASGISSLWARTLNLAYVFFVIVMIIAGFMIMFRHKLGGQTMVTLGSVLPRVITSLVLATFSFAIAGLVIDVGGVLNGLIAFVLELDGDITPISGLGGLMMSVLSGGLGVTALISGGIGALGLGVFFGTGGIATLLTVGSGPIGWGVATLVVGAIGLIGIVLALVILGIILTGAIKVLITLYKAYFSLLLAVILGPLQITLGAIPGNSHVVKNWLFSILRNVLVFPIVLFIVNIPNAIASSGSDVLLRFPGKLVYEDPSTYTSSGVNVAGGIFIIILKIAVLFFAAQAPKYLEAWFPPSTPEAFGKGMEAARGSLSKIPVLGGLFK